jgi:hypothetical protein
MLPRSCSSVCIFTDQNNLPCLPLVGILTDHHAFYIFNYPTNLYPWSVLSTAIIRFIFLITNQSLRLVGNNTDNGQGIRTGRP